MRKLTLSAEPEIIDLAKRLAGEHSTSVSEMFSQFVRSMAKPNHAGKIAAKTKMASGLVKLPKGKTDRQLIEDAMAEGFLR